MGTLCKFQPQVTEKNTKTEVQAGLRRPSGSPPEVQNLEEELRINQRKNTQQDSQDTSKVKGVQTSEKDYVTDSYVSDEEPIIFGTPINESVIPGVVSGNPCEAENINFSHAQNIEPGPRNSKDRSKKEKGMCHAETSNGQINTYKSHIYYSSFEATCWSSGSLGFRDKKRIGDMQ